ncbi:MAG: hypothetical protein RIR17_1720 [Planctomycetota bacterium]
MAFNLMNAMYGIEIDFAPSKPGASLRSAPGYRITPRWGLENIAYAPKGHDEKAQGHALGKERYKNKPKP